MPTQFLEEVRNTPARKDGLPLQAVEFGYYCLLATINSARYNYARP